MLYSGVSIRTSNSVVQPLAHFLAGLEKRNEFFRNINLLACAGIAPAPRATLANRKCTKAPKFDPVAASECVSNFVEDCVDNILNVTLK